MAQRLPGPFGQPGSFIDPDAAHVQGPEGVAISPGRAEIEHRTVGELQPEVGFAVDLGLAVLGQGDAVHQIRVGVELELDLLDDGIEVPLVRSRDEALAASGGEGVMERVGREHDGLAHVPAVEVDDVLGRAAQVLHLVRPVVAA